MKMIIMMLNNYSDNMVAMMTIKMMGLMMMLLQMMLQMKDEDHNDGDG